MQRTTQFDQYAQAFEQTYADDDWSRLEAFFTEDAVYHSDDGPMVFRAEGRDAVLAQLRDSVNAFDRKFARRELKVLDGPTEQEPDGVWVRWEVTYSQPGAPPLAISGTETARYADDRIVELIDVFDPACGPAMQAWMAEHGGTLTGA